MNLETLAQDVFDKKQDVSNKRLALSRVKIALSDAESMLIKALCDANGPMYNQVAINLRDHVLICDSDGDSEYAFTFIETVPNANT